MPPPNPDRRSPPIHQLRADVARAEALLEQVRQLLGLAAGVSFGDIEPDRLADDPGEDATTRVGKLADDATACLSEVESGFPWLVALSDEERARLQAEAPTAAQSAAIRDMVEMLCAMDPEAFDKAAREAGASAGQVMTRADVEKLRDDLERIDLMERLAARTSELTTVARSMQAGEIEALGRELGELRAAKRRN